ASPLSGSTPSSLPTITVQWCDADGSLSAHDVRLDGVLLPDAFVASSATGCSSAGTSTWTAYTTSAGPHTLSAVATDMAGHSASAVSTFTLSLPVIGDYRPSVAPKGAIRLSSAGLAASQWFVVRNAGSRAATYSLSSVCSASPSCSLSRASLTLAP